MKEKLAISVFVIFFVFGCSNSHSLSSLSLDELKKKFSEAFQSSDYEKVLSHVTEIVRRNPNDCEALANRSIILAILNKFDDAKNDIDTCKNLEKSQSRDYQFYVVHIPAKPITHSGRRRSLKLVTLKS